MAKVEVEAKIEYQKVIGDANPSGYQPIRFTRVKYKASAETHIDIRKFQRGYDEEGNDVYFPTKNGFRFLEREFGRVIKEYTLLPETYVHPKIIEKSFSYYKMENMKAPYYKRLNVLKQALEIRLEPTLKMWGLN